MLSEKTGAEATGPGEHPMGTDHKGQKGRSPSKKESLGEMLVQRLLPKPELQRGTPGVQHMQGVSGDMHTHADTHTADPGTMQGLRAPTPAESKICIPPKP